MFKNLAVRYPYYSSILFENISGQVKTKNLIFLRAQKRYSFFTHHHPHNDISDVSSMRYLQRAHALIIGHLSDEWEKKKKNLNFVVGFRLQSLTQSASWCPTSKLCGLPLHAAGMYSPKFPKPNCIPDCYVSSYTPSLSALIMARSGLETGTTNPNLLVIAQPDETLPKVKEEIGHIQRLSKDNADVRVLEGEDANHDTVLSGLRTHSWVHFACHGHLNDQPFHSSFQLHMTTAVWNWSSWYQHSFLMRNWHFSQPVTQRREMWLAPRMRSSILLPPCSSVDFVAWWEQCGQWKMMMDVMLRRIFISICFVLHELYRILETRPRRFISNHMAIREMRKWGLGMVRWVKFVHVGAWWRWAVE